MLFCNVHNDSIIRLSFAETRHTLSLKPGDDDFQVNVCQTNQFSFISTSVQKVTSLSPDGSLLAVGGIHDVSSL